MNGELTLLAGAVLLFSAMAVVAGTLLAPARDRVRLDGPRVAPAPKGSSGLRDLATSATAVAEKTLAKHDQRRAIDNALEQAGLLVRPAELALVVAIAGAVLGAIGLLVGGVLVAMLGAAMAPVGAKVFLGIKRDRRRSAFAAQLDDLLQLIAGNLRAGYGLQQALESAGEEMASPASDELRRLTTEIRLGRDTAECLEAMATRVDSEDFLWVTSAIRIHREVGGDLGEVLDRVSETIRARNHVKRQVKSLSAEGRLSAYVLFGLPIALAVMIKAMNPDYFAPLLETMLGRTMIGAGVVLMTAGAFWLRKLVKVVY